MPVGPGTYNKVNPYNPKYPVINLQENDFNATIANHGVRVSHEKSMLCPNVVGRLGTGEHDANCEACEGGFLYYDRQEVFAVHQDNELKEFFQINGLWEANTVLLSTPTKLDDNVTEFYVHRFDRIILLDFLVRISERLERDTSRTYDILRYKACTIEQVERIEADGITRKIYVQGTDYEIEPDDGNITWLPGGDNPAELEIYTISYYYQPVYLVDMQLHEGRYSLNGFKKATKTANRLPQALICKRDFLFEKRDDDTGEKFKETIRYL